MPLIQAHGSAPLQEFFTVEFRRAGGKWQSTGFGYADRAEAQRDANGYTWEGMMSRVGRLIRANASEDDH